MLVSEIEQDFLSLCRIDKEGHKLYHDWLIDEGRTLDANALKVTKNIQKFEDLKGMTLCAIEKGTFDDNDCIDLYIANGIHCRLFYIQDCCASVGIEDIQGNINDLIGAPLEIVEESTNSMEHPEDKKDKDSSYGTFTWTFYRMATRKGYVTIRWYGSSNGYYSESVSFGLVKE